MRDQLVYLTAILAFTAFAMANTGVYMDNGKPYSGIFLWLYLKFFLLFQGNGHTMSLVDADQKERIQMEILDLLGMKHVPNKRAPHFSSHLGNKTVIWF